MSPDMKIKFFIPSDNLLDWTLVDELEVGKRAPSTIIKRSEQYWIYNSGLQARDEHFLSGYLVYTLSEPPTEM